MWFNQFQLPQPAGGQVLGWPTGGGATVPVPGNVMGGAAGPSVIPGYGGKVEAGAPVQAGAGGVGTTDGAGQVMRQASGASSTPGYSGDGQPSRGGGVPTASGTVDAPGQAIGQAAGPSTTPGFSPTTSLPDSNYIGGGRGAGVPNAGGQPGRGADTPDSGGLAAPPSPMAPPNGTPNVGGWYYGQTGMGQSGGSYQPPPPSQPLAATAGPSITPGFEPSEPSAPMPELPMQPGFTTRGAAAVANSRATGAPTGPGNYTTTTTAPTQPGAAAGFYSYLGSQNPAAPYNPFPAATGQAGYNPYTANNRLASAGQPNTQITGVRQAPVSGAFGNG